MTDEEIAALQHPDQSERRKRSSSTPAVRAHREVAWHLNKPAPLLETSSPPRSCTGAPKKHPGSTREVPGPGLSLVLLRDTFFVIRVRSEADFGALAVYGSEETALVSSKICLLLHIRRNGRNIQYRPRSDRRATGGSACIKRARAGGTQTREGRPTDSRQKRWRDNTITTVAVESSSAELSRAPRCS